MSEGSKSVNSVTKLTSTNYATWKGEMKAYLRVKGLWLLVNGTDTDAQAKWDVKADKAAGELYLACSVEQRMHIEAVQDNPVQIWTTLASVMTMVCSLGEEYSHFASSLMLLKSLDKDELKAAFLAEESQ